MQWVAAAAYRKGASEHGDVGHVADDGLQVFRRARIQLHICQHRLHRCVVSVLRSTHFVRSPTTAMIRLSCSDISDVGPVHRSFFTTLPALMIPLSSHVKSKAHPGGSACVLPILRRGQQVGSIREAHLKEVAAAAAVVGLQGILGHADVDGLDLDVVVQRADQDSLLVVRERPQVLAGQVHCGVDRRQRRVLHRYRTI